MRTIIVGVPETIAIAIAMTKTATFAIVHFSVAFGVTWLLTGSLALGGLIALVEPLANTVAYHVHEKAWTRFGRRRACTTVAA